MSAGVSRHCTSNNGDAELDKEREQLIEHGGITYANVAALMKLPGLDDMDYEPEGVTKS